MEHVQEEIYTKAIANIGSLHGNMAVLSKLDEILKDYNSELSDAEELLQSDGAIAATIVKISNSALYNSGEKNDNLSEALQKVGFSQTRKLVSMALSKQVFMRDLESYGVSADSYWRYSYFSAVFMEMNASEVNMESGDAYMLGLLHSIGRVVINELLRANEIEVYWDCFIPESTWETSMVGFTNGTAGSLLLESWAFSEEMCKRVKTQINPEAQAADPALLLLDYTQQLALHHLDPDRIEALCKPGGHPYLKTQDLSEEEMLENVKTALVNLEETYESLKNS